MTEQDREFLKSLRIRPDEDICSDLTEQQKQLMRRFHDAFCQPEDVGHYPWESYQ